MSQDHISILVNEDNGREPGCHDAAEADDDGELRITDDVRILGDLFPGGAVPGLRRGSGGHGRPAVRAAGGVPLVDRGDVSGRSARRGHCGLGTISSMPKLEYGDVSWERMIRAVEKVKERLLRTAAALEQAGIPYAMAGGNAVAAWVSRVDEAAVRNTQDVDVLIRRLDLDRITETLSRVGFVRRHVAGIELFLDGPQAKARDAVHVVFAGEKVRAEYVAPAPEVTESEPGTGFRVLNLEALVRMKLTSFRTKDQMHLRDLLDVGLIDASWCQRLQPELAARLQTILDTPEG